MLDEEFRGSYALAIDWRRTETDRGSFSAALGIPPSACNTEYQLASY